jgi:CBS domain-containing protein
MGFEVRQLLERKGPPTTATATDVARSAVDQMRRFDFSQLPVVDGKKVIGLVSNESILRQLLHFGCSIDKLTVRDAMEKSNLIAPDAGLDELLDALSKDSAALVVDRDHTLLGIVTDYDTTAWFREDVEDRMHLADVEQVVRGLALRPFGGAADSSELKAVIRSLGSGSQRTAFMRALSDIGEKIDQAKSIEAFEKHFLSDRDFHLLTFGDYIQLVDDKTRWASHLGSLLGDKRGEVVAVLKRVRDARNAIAHLRGLSTDQREDIRESAKWLARMMGGIPPVVGPVTTKTEGVSSDTTAVVGDPRPSVDDEVGADAATYTSLSRFLQELPDDTGSLGMPFTTIESILGRSLPPSARRHTAWWANDSSSHTQSKAWLDVGWRVSAVQLDEDVVVFSRAEGDRQQAYREFFAELSRQLRERKKIPVSSAQALGRSWHSLASLRTTDSSAGWIGSSFAKGRRFRVETYLRTGSPTRTKALFDALHADKAAIEAEIGMPLEWERLDHREASRIARYWDVTIEADESDLDRLILDAVYVAEKMYASMSRRLTVVTPHG